MPSGILASRARSVSTMRWADRLASRNVGGSSPPLMMGSSSIREALRLVHAAADGAGDEEVTPSRIAGVIQKALRRPEARDVAVHRHLQEALDAVSDGMPADFIATCLYAALEVKAKAPEG